MCATNRVPVSYELTAANVGDVLLVRELLAGADLEEGGVARKLFGDLAYRSGTLGEELAEAGVLLATERADRRPQVRQQVEVCFAALKRAFGIGETLAITLAGLVTRIAAKVCAYTPTASTSTDSSGGRRGASRSCGPDVPATLI